MCLRNAGRAPIYSHLSATLQGLPVIRAFKMEDQFIQEYYKYQDRHTSACNLFMSSFRWFGIRVDWCVYVYYTGCIIAAFMFSNKGGNEACLGLSLSYIISLLGSFQFVVRQTAEVESYVSVLLIIISISIIHALLKAIDLSATM